MSIAPPADRSLLWVFPAPCDAADLDRLCAACGIPRPVAEIALRRLGADATADRVDRYLHPAFRDLHDPYLMPGMKAAVERIAMAVYLREPVTVFGDYDADGTSATALMVEALSRLGLSVAWRIPDRVTEGYGLSDAGVDRVLETPGSLVVLLDCGVTAVDQIARLAKEGREVIVVDHHEPGPRLPDAVAILDPKLPDSRYPFDGLAAVGVAFKLVFALSDALGVPPGTLLLPALDLVALGTAADIVPIVDENRVLMRHGLRRLQRQPRPGLAALLAVSGLEGKPVETSNIVFGLGPRINAAGRVGNVGDAVRLLLTGSQREAHALAMQLNRSNRERQAMDRHVLDEARVRAAEQVAAGARAIVLSDPDWHPGIIGIVAARLVEQFGLPSILIARQSPIGRGSGRSVPGFDLFAALSGCSELVVGFGGHVKAAGLSIRPDQVDAFAARFQEIAAACITDESLRSRLEIDAEVALGEVSPELVRQMDRLGPFGPENRRPVLATRGLRTVSPPTVLRDEHLKFRVSVNGAIREAIAFGQAASAPLLAGPVDLAYVAEEDRYRDAVRLQLRVKAIRPAG